VRCASAQERAFRNRPRTPDSGNEDNSIFTHSPSLARDLVLRRRLAGVARGVCYMSLPNGEARDALYPSKPAAQLANGHGR
jgi:hypothetical protein